MNNVEVTWRLIYKVIFFEWDNDILGKNQVLQLPTQAKLVQKSQSGPGSPKKPR